MLSARTLVRSAASARTMAVSARFYTEGATGAPRPQGSNDSFNVSFSFCFFSFCSLKEPLFSGMNCQLTYSS